MTAQSNLLGAIIFWLYIVAALIFTFLVINSIVRLPSPKASKHVATFTVLAIISFSILSFNMLHVLFTSYNTWLESLVPVPLLSPRSIWSWSISSRQFRDFGEAIVENGARYLWTQSSLMATLSVSFFMAFEGSRHKVPRLWAYFALAQILPISFAQNLFFIAILRSKDQRSNVVVSGGHALPLVLLYCMFLSVAPLATKTGGFMSIIAMARVFLALPLVFVNIPDGIEQDPFFNWTGLLGHREAQTAVWLCAAVMNMKQYVSAAADGYSDGQIYQALYSHPAVTTLGLDLIITMTSFAVWIAVACGQGLVKTGPEKTS